MARRLLPSPAGSSRHQKTLGRTVAIWLTFRHMYGYDYEAQQQGAIGEAGSPTHPSEHWLAAGVVAATHRSNRWTMCLMR